MNFISVNLGDGSLEIVEVETDDASVNIKGIYARDFELGELSDRKIKEISDIISSGRRFDDEDTNIAFCIDSNYAFLNIIPVDLNLSSDEFREHINWELSQYYPDEKPSDFIARGYRFRESGAEVGSTGKALIVAVRSDLISFIKSISGELNLRTRIIDIDHFATENCLRRRINGGRSRYVYRNFILFGIKNSRVDVSIFTNYEFNNYLYYPIQGLPDIKYFILKVSREYDWREMDRFISYGRALDTNGINFMRDIFGDKFEILDPFQTEITFEINSPIERGHMYAPNFGLILRMLWSG